MTSVFQGLSRVGENPGNEVVMTAGHSLTRVLSSRTKVNSPKHRVRYDSGVKVLLQPKIGGHTESILLPDGSYGNNESILSLGKV